LRTAGSSIREPDTKEHLTSKAAVLHQQVVELEAAEIARKLEENLNELEHEFHLFDQSASIVQLAADVAHEVNNHLTGILGFSQRLLRKTTDEEVSRDLRRIHAEAQRAAEVVQELVTVIHHLESKMETEDKSEHKKQKEGNYSKSIGSGEIRRSNGR
jgi:signal transduction histidine kinase